ncbi:MAG: glycosyltransferase family 4 protein [Chitinophagales bacterium]
MKIALVSNMYPSKQDPVFGIFVKNTESLLAENGIQTISKAVIKGRKKSLGKILSYLKFYFDIFLVFLNPKVKLIYVHFPLQSSLILLVLKKLSNKKVILNIHGSELNKNSFFYKYFTNLLKISDFVIVPSTYYKNRLIDELNTDNSKIYIFPSGGINKEVFYPLNKTKIRNELNYNTNWFICSYISTITEQKGWKVYFEAAILMLEKGLNIKFLIVGNGDNEEVFYKLVKDSKFSDSFIFESRQQQQNLVKYFSASNVFIFPTYRKEESLGLVGLESMACGTPVIGSKLGAIQDYIKNGINGFLFEPKNPKDLAKKIEQFYNSDQKDNFSKEALKTAAKFDSKNCSFALAKKLKEL